MGCRVSSVERALMERPAERAGENEGGVAQTEAGRDDLRRRGVVRFIPRSALFPLAPFGTALRPRPHAPARTRPIASTGRVCPCRRSSSAW
jgi:hypothetical protein